MATPTVSVIVTTCDRPRLLRDALTSGAAQSPPPLEVRVADDGGGHAGSVADDLPILQLTWLSLRLGQPGAARNAAAAGARGEVLAFLDDDDRWRAGHLAGLAAAFADPGVGLAWRDAEVMREEVGEDGARRVLATRTLAHDWDDALMRSDDYLPPSSFAVRRSLFEAAGGFDPSFRYSEDWDLLLRLAPRTKARRVPGVTAEIRLRGTGNDSADFNAERLDCLRRLAERHGFATPEPKTFWEVALAVGRA